MSRDIWVGNCEIGNGLFAGRHFNRGELILTLRGPRFTRDDPIHQHEIGANLLQTGPRTYILLEPPGVFANHSCHPNAGIMNTRELVAIRDIVPDEEIRFDYSTTMDEDQWTMPCRCGQLGCRHTVTDFKLLPDTLRTQYLALGIVPRFIARKYG
ncbi:MAG: SET domain-containing protein [bacterium]